MIDRFGRKIEYMRISITDRCNLRCRYCMPAGIKTEKLPMDKILTYEEIVEVVRAAVDCGITRFKITGGEPLARKGCPELIGMIKKIPGVQQVTMTTNGVLLEKFLPELMDAGLDAVNISLDTLNPQTFKAITGYDYFEDVIRGINSAVDAGLPVKINSVLQKGVNDNEWEDLINIAKDKKADVRFIEMMPIGCGRDYEEVSNEKVFQRIRDKYPEVIEDISIHGNGPARYVKIPGFMGSIGFVSAIHGKFCGECNRIRLTAAGRIKPCLCYGNTYDVFSVFRGNETSDIYSEKSRHEMLKSVIRKAVNNKPAQHCFEKLSEITESREMVKIGG